MIRNFFKSFLRPEVAKTVGDDEIFVTLIQVASEDEAIRSRIIQIASVTGFHRKSLLGSMLREMKLKLAPVELIEALRYLKDDNVARKVIELLESSHGG